VWSVIGVYIVNGNLFLFCSPWKLVGNLRDGHRDIGKVIGAQCVQSLIELFWGIFAVVLDVAALEIAVKRVEVEKGRNVRVRRGAVVALVEVVRQGLPVVLAVELVGVVQLVVAKVHLAVPLLHVDVLEVLVPAHLGLFLGVHVDPDEAVLVNLGVDPEQPVLILFRLVHVLEAGGLGELAV
jgi:hypothetical protein